MSKAHNMTENMVIGKIDALKLELLSRFGLLLRTNAQLEERINTLEVLLISLNNCAFPSLENRIDALEGHSKMLDEYNDQVAIHNAGIDQFNRSIDITKEEQP